MTGSRIAAALLVGGALLTVAPRALADPSEQDRAHARDLMADGRDKRDKNDLAGALESFKQADAIMHVPTTGYEVARTQQQLGKLLEARETVDAIARLPVSPNDPAPFAEARAKAEALAKELDRQIAQLKLSYRGGKPSSVTIDDAPVANLDAPARVLPGKHVVVAHGGDGDARSEVTVAGNETKTVELALPTQAAVALPPASTTQHEFHLPMLSWVGFGVGAAGLVVGSITGVMAIGAESDLAQKCPDPKKCDRSQSDNLDSARTKATISTVGFIVGGVGIAVGVVGLILRPKTEAKVGAVTIDYARLRATF